MLGKIEGKRRRQRQDEMVGWHHRLNGHEFEQALGDGEGQRSLVCCGPWGRRELDTTERLKINSRIYGEDGPWSWQRQYLKCHLLKPHLMLWMRNGSQGSGGGNCPSPGYTAITG